MSNCYLIFASHDIFYSYSYCSRIPRRGAGAVRSNGEKVHGKEEREPNEPNEHEPDKWNSRQWQFIELLSSCRLQDAKRNAHFSKQLVV